MAPTSPASTIGAVTSASSKKPPEMVLATSVDRQAPTRLRTAAMMTAVRGLSAPVAIGPAMALALSWNPLVKSKIEGDDDHHDDHEQHCHAGSPSTPAGAVPAAAAARRQNDNPGEREVNAAVTGAG